jgi:hypothetical protein
MQRITRSWQLWAALKRPPKHHPVFVWATTQSTRPIVSGWLVGAVMVYYLALSTALQNAPSSPTGGNPTLWLLLFTPLALLAVGFSGSTYGATWVLRVCDSFQAAQANSLYDLVAASPAGHAGTAWSLATGVLHRGNTLAHIPDLEQPFTRGGALAAIVLIVLLLLFPQGRATLLPLAIAVVVVLFVYTDYVQSAGVALLIGVWANVQFAEHATDTRWGAVAAFAGTQLLTYGLLLLVIGVGFPQVGLSPFGMMGLPQLGLFYLIREPIIGALWATLDKTLLPESLVPHHVPTANRTPLA